MADDLTLFVDLPFNADANSLIDDATDNLRAAWPGWEPDDADLEIIMLEEAGPMAVAAIQQASQMPGAALRAYGTKLMGIEYSPGTPSWTTVTFEVVDNAGHTIDSGSELNIDGFIFQLLADAIVPTGDTTVSAPVYATENTAAANDLPGLVVTQLLMPAFVVGMSVDAPTHGGVDPDDDGVFQSKISRKLRLRSDTIVTATDFILEALEQDGIGRVAVIGNTARQVTVAIADISGEVVNPTIKANLAAIYAAQRMINYTVNIDDPTYTTVDIAWHAVALPGYTQSDLLARGNARLEQVLAPAGYGQPVNTGDVGSSVWNNEPVIYPNWLIGVLSQVQGIDRVVSVTISGAAGDGTLTLAGTFPLPRPGTMTGTVDLPS